jgi:hypothetical protein
MKIQTNNETFETLWEYCTANNRLCPNPQKWNDLYKMLKTQSEYLLADGNHHFL